VGVFLPVRRLGKIAQLSLEELEHVTAESIEAFCPDCNRISALEVRSEAFADAPQQLHDLLDPGEDGLRIARYTTAFCPKCRGVFLHVRAKSEPSEIPYEVVLYPAPERRGIPGLPEGARRAYESAQSCFGASNFDPCVIMCRKCLEATCGSLGVQKGSLAERLRQLRDSGRIEARLYEWADQLRLIGNDAAHDLDIHISRQDAVDSLDFVEAILQYVFVLDQKFREFRDRRQGGQLI
jgi:hypothetical protein